MPRSVSRIYAGVNLGQHLFNPLLLGTRSGSCHFILYEPPDSRKLRFLSLQPLELGTTTYSLIESDSIDIRGTSIEPCNLTGVFAEPHARSIDLEAVITHLNTVKVLQRCLAGNRNRNTSHQPNRPIRSYQSVRDTLQYPISTWLFILNYRLVGRNSLRDVSATGMMQSDRIRVHYR